MPGLVVSDADLHLELAAIVYYVAFHSNGILHEFFVRDPGHLVFVEGHVIPGNPALIREYSKIDILTGMWQSWQVLPVLGSL